MCELATVLGLDDKPMEVDVPKDLVRALPGQGSSFSDDRASQPSRYNADFSPPIAFASQGISDVLAKTLAKQGINRPTSQR